jgi:hypothetical protein
MPKGGAREGAGRKTLPEEEKTRPVTLHLTPDTRALWDKYRARSGKSASEALRDLLMDGGGSLLPEEVEP